MVAVLPEGDHIMEVLVISALSVVAVQPVSLEGTPLVSICIGKVQRIIVNIC